MQYQGRLWSCADGCDAADGWSVSTTWPMGGNSSPLPEFRFATDGQTWAALGDQLSTCDGCLPTYPDLLVSLADLGATSSRLRLTRNDQPRVLGHLQGTATYLGCDLDCEFDANWEHVAIPEAAPILVDLWMDDDDMPVLLTRADGYLTVHRGSAP
jgi:hypothetical protein